MPSSQKRFRVFVSSTFTDMRQERQILQKQVFPRLKALCESMGASFQDVDLRWGVDEEAHLDQKTMDICLGEIARCQRLSPKPNFIILLGDKYGWQPVPEKIPTDEMALILSAVDDGERQSIEKWYREDMNAVPPEYVLQPRGNHYPSFDDWEAVEDKLRRILREAVDKLNFTDNQRVKYFASATHQEILAGALGLAPHVIDPEKHVFAYLRSIRDLPQDATGKDFIDLSGNGRDLYSKEQLKRLKEALRAKLPREHIYDYGANWNGDCVLDDTEGFGKRVYADLSAIIESRLQEEIEDVDPLMREIGRHAEFKARRLEHFAGRHEALAAIRRYLDSNVNKVFSIIGASGTGKTSLIAKAVQDAGNRNGILVFRFLGTTSAASDAYQLISGLVREIAASYGKDVNTLLEKGDNETMFSSPEGLLEILPRCLSLGNKRQPLMIYLDALDQLSGDYAALRLNWMPKDIPEHTKIVVSALPEIRDKLPHAITYELGPMPLTEGEQLLETWLASVNRTLQPHQKREVMHKFAQNGTPLYLKLAFEKARTWRSYSISTSIGEGVEGVLGEYFTELEKNHGNLLMAKASSYILSGKYQGLTENEMVGLLVFDGEYWQHFLAHCHPSHRQEVHEIGKLPIVVWSRLFLDLEPYLTERTAEGVPVISFYHRKFAEYVSKRYLGDGEMNAGTDNDGASAIKGVSEATGRSALAVGLSEAIKYHYILSEYFEEQPLYLDEKEKTPNVRKVVEQPYQEIMAKQWSNVAVKSLANFLFLMAKVKADIVEGILDDYRLALRKAPIMAAEQFRIWKAFFGSRAHILRRGTGEWPAYKIFFQVAVEHAEESPVTIAAERFLDEGKVDWTWIRKIHRVKNAGIDPCLAVLEDHASKVKGALELEDGSILSWSYDKTLRIWDANGKPIAKLAGHRDSILGAFQLRDSNILSWSSGKTLRIWDRYGKQIAIIEGHSLQVEGAFELKDGNILSWSGDSIHIWNRLGTPIASFEGHTSFVDGVIELKDGKILSWALDSICIWDALGKPLESIGRFPFNPTRAFEMKDGRVFVCSKDDTLSIWERGGKQIETLEGNSSTGYRALHLRDGNIVSWARENTLHIRDREGKQIAILEGHRDNVLGVRELKDGSIVSWSSDNTLRIWDRLGTPIAILEGHTSSVGGVIELKDGNLLSWSADNTLRIWSKHSELVVGLDEHMSEVKGILQLKDESILSWSQRNLRIWDKEGKQIAILEGHPNNVLGARELKDGSIVSWSSDNTLRIWDRLGSPPIASLEGHTRSVGGVIELNDGNILSWSGDSIHIWNRLGTPIASLEGHTDRGSFDGVIELKDGKILAWGSDATLWIWDRVLKPLASVQIQGYYLDGANGARELKGSRVLSTLKDVILRTWDRHTEGIIGFDRHMSEVKGILQLKDENILSWSQRNLRIWDKEGKQIAILEGHRNDVLGARELKDGSIVSWSSDNTLRIWDMEGKPIAKLDRHLDTVTGALGLRDGKLLSWSADKTLRIWNKEGKQVATLAEVVSDIPDLDGETLAWRRDRRLIWKEHQEHLKAIAKPESDTLELEVNGALELWDGSILSWSADTTLRISDREGKLVTTLEGHTGFVFGAIELKDGNLVSWSADKTLRIWDLERDPIAELDGHTEPVKGALELKDGNILSWSYDRTLRIWDMEGKPIAKLDGHLDTVTGALGLRDGSILSWASDGIRMWDNRGRSLPSGEGKWGAVDGALELKNGNILSWSSDKTLRIWERQGEPVANLKGHTHSVRGALELRDGNIISWAADNTLRVWDWHGNPLANLEGHRGDVKEALELKDGNILSWSADSIRVWESAGKPVASLEGHTGVVRGVLELKNGNILSWSSDRNFHVWDKLCQPISKSEGHKGLATGASKLGNDNILSWSTDKTFHIWDKRCQPITKSGGHTSPVLGAFELRNDNILSWSTDKTLRIWEKDGKQIATLQGHRRAAEGALELEDGSILSWSPDNTLRLWGARGKPIITLKRHQREVNGALQLSDGSILSWSKDSIRIWDRLGNETTSLKGHWDAIMGVFELKDGNILSWSKDSIRIWDRLGNETTSLKGHWDAIMGVFELKDGNILSWSDDSTRFWDSKGKPIPRTHGMLRFINRAVGFWQRHRERILRPKGSWGEHWSEVYDELELKDGNIISWSNNSTRFWDSKGKPIPRTHGMLRFINRAVGFWQRHGEPIVSLKGHRGEVDAVLELKNGKILSRSQDKTLRIWDKEGKQIAILEGHSWPVYGAFEIKDGNIFSYSKDSIRIWNNKGKPVASLEGVWDAVKGVFRLKDRDASSWSEYSFRIRNRHCKQVAKSSIEEGLATLQLEHDKKRPLSSFRLSPRGYTVILRPYQYEKEPAFFWQAACECSACFLKPEGIMIITQTDGQICFLRLYHSNRQITIKELEEMHELAYQGKKQKTGGTNL